MMLAKKVKSRSSFEVKNIKDYFLRIRRQVSIIVK